MVSMLAIFPVSALGDPEIVRRAYDVNNANGTCDAFDPGPDVAPASVALGYWHFRNGAGAEDFNQPWVGLGMPGNGFFALWHGSSQSACGRVGPGPLSTYRDGALWIR